MATYDSLAELLKNEDPLNVEARLDNDHVSFRLKGDDEGDDLLGIDPYDLQRQALDLLGIDNEPV